MPVFSNRPQFWNLLETGWATRAGPCYRHWLIFFSQEPILFLSLIETITALVTLAYKPQSLLNYQFCGPQTWTALQRSMICWILWQSRKLLDLSWLQKLARQWGVFQPTNPSFCKVQMWWFMVRKAVLLSILHRASEMFYNKFHWVMNNKDIWYNSVPDFLWSSRNAFVKL